MNLSAREKSRYLFIFGCAPVRLIFALSFLLYSVNTVKLMSGVLLLPAIGFIYLYITHTRLTGPEVFGGKIWWAPLRIVHGILYLIASITAYRGLRVPTVMVLLADVIFGIFAEIFYPK